ncbi:hypothetical protein BGV71_13990 [Burkholderia ubonensis]|uniref:hypothetical protein n=1 Tax=Burkholderia ubonensis TaxID=101571 RepID=UPI000756DA7F|nr:hypothetical protein [Burkholderia ubonensis]KVC85122.1 hypothetical protein WI76_06760 [Burkholderia ubonensis]KVZ30839.1 hypothetical protein WL13_29780 [Burkholderia ubonensis]KWB30081.1 hypothetical protein WL33_24670 [Burkholderia ubonensis]KWC30661.1 hypothetical protein WL50_27030 [Burkholderia ubonensis]OJA83231.1 hypothetical protein BGV71_13990 [Burkholderia ubonensis]
MKQPVKTARFAARALTLMSDGQDWTIPALASALDMSSTRVRKALQILSSANKIYLCGLIEPSHKKVYRIVDSAGPVPADHLVEHVYEDDPKREAELDRRYRCRATWWPSADQTLNSAMIAMVRTRSSAS